MAPADELPPLKEAVGKRECLPVPVLLPVLVHGVSGGNRAPIEYGYEYAYAYGRKSTVSKKGDRGDSAMESIERLPLNPRRRCDDNRAVGSHWRIPLNSPFFKGGSPAHAVAFELHRDTTFT
jgi:hypothetical protein